MAIGSPILEESELCKKEYAEKELSIEAIGYENGYFIDRGNTELFTNIVAEAGIEKVEFYVNDFLKFTSTTEPYRGIVRITSPNNTPVQLKLKVFDKNDFVVEKNYNLIVGDSRKNPKPETEDSKENNLDQDQDQEQTPKLNPEIILNPNGLANELEFDSNKIEN